MPFWDPLFKKPISPDSVKVKALEEKVEKLSSELKDSQNKIIEITKLLNYAISSQKQLSLDMNIIYDSVNQVAESLQANHTEDDEKYFKWRWTVNDDDDLPN